MNFVGLALDLQLEGGTWAKDLKIGYIQYILVMYSRFKVVSYQSVCFIILKARFLILLKKKGSFLHFMMATVWFCTQSVNE